MKVLLVHPSCLLYSEIYLRLEPLGLELVAEVARRAGHDVRLLDLQVFKARDYFHTLDTWHPDAVGFSLNYLANIPEVVDLAKASRSHLREAFLFAGGHSASFTAREILQHSEGTLDCVVRGEAEEAIVPLLEAAANDRRAITRVPGVVSQHGDGLPPQLIHTLR